MELNKKTIKLGGYREGAGRKKELPDDARVTSFKLTEAERRAVKKFIEEMRGKTTKQEALEKENKAHRIMVDASKPVSEALLEIIKIYGDRKRGFRKAEEYSKMLAVGAFKDAVQMWENENK